MDTVSMAQRSRNMAAVRQKDTKPEIAVRRVLHSLGLRFRLHQVGLPGRPDIVLTRHRTVVLVHGCFWHGHTCARGKAPSTNRDFWLPKQDANRRRDRLQAKALRALGWRVLTIWECQIRDVSKLRQRLSRYLAGSNVC
jgi:DNA mismatch endonuclease (patch repair protein)